MKLPLQNIAQHKNDILLFLRDPKTKKLEIKIEKKYSSYYYKESPSGDYYTYENTKAFKVDALNIPKDIKSARGVFESDVPLVKKYLLQQDVEIIKSPLRYVLFDIEVLALPNTSIVKGNSPISCITTWDSLTGKYRQFYLGDYPNLNDKQLIVDFANYIQDIKPDMLLAWFISFDWGYLTKRNPSIAKLISPVKKSRYGGGKDAVDAPMGISIVDYLQFFKKVYMREASYKLDDVCEHYLSKGKQHKEVDFGVLDEVIKERNLEDVQLMVELEQQCQLLPYYDEIRRLTKVSWEELYHNSKAIEMICLSEAKKMKLALPNKKAHNVKAAFQGAVRGSENGVFYNIGKYDLSGAYPAAIINFCLDETNISTKDDPDAININGTYFKQNPNTLIPLVAKKMVTLKEKVGKELAETSKEHKTYSQIKNQYNGIKGVVNSTFGVLGNQYFRLYNDKVVSAITFLIRDLLTYVQNELTALGYNIIYYDTDSIFIEHCENMVDLLNDLIQEWGALKYNKDSITLNFAYEGHFNELLILGTCHYYGNIKTPTKGTYPEIKGIEMKRSSSTKFEAEFQEMLIKKVLAKESKEEIEKWVKKERERIKKVPITDFAFPAKRAIDKVYKNIPIFVRAINNSKLYSDNFEVKAGDKYFYVYIKSIGKDANEKPINVLAFKDFSDCGILSLIEKNIDWVKMSDRNIEKKVVGIFKAMGWEENKTDKGLFTFIEEINDKQNNKKSKLDSAF